MDPSHQRAFGAPVAAAQPESDVSADGAEIEPLSTSHGRIAAHARWGWLIPAFLLLAMIVLGVGICDVHDRPDIRPARFELSRVSDLWLALLHHRSPEPAFENARGRELWECVMQRQGIDDSIHSTLVSVNGPDDSIKKPLAGQPAELPPENCSFTAPQGSAITHLLQRKGSDRRVLVCHNARNWHNFPDHGVVVLWSDREEAEWLTFQQAAKDWGITEAEWADPAGKLFGKKAPFEYTYE